MKSMSAAVPSMTVMVAHARRYPQIDFQDISYYSAPKQKSEKVQAPAVHPFSPLHINQSCLVPASRRRHSKRARPASCGSEANFQRQCELYQRRRVVLPVVRESCMPI